MDRVESLALEAAEGRRLDDAEVRELADAARRDPELVIEAAGRLQGCAHRPADHVLEEGLHPLTKLCRDSCGYCTFAHPPRPGEPAYLTLDEVLEIARAGEAAGCDEALFTLGDKPERKWPEARAELEAMGYATTIEYLVAACRAVLDETSLLPHANPGALTDEETVALRAVSA